jgi:hypothetical protein
MLHWQQVGRLPLLGRDDMYEELRAQCSGTYGISILGNTATLNFITSNSSGKNVGSRLYLSDTSDAGYQSPVRTLSVLTRYILT